MSETLKRSVSYLRPLYYYTATGKGRPIEKIVIFNKTNEWVVNNGWLENYDPVLEHYRDVEEMIFESLPVKRKVDFSRTYSYLANYEGDFTLFIYAAEIKVENKLKYSDNYGMYYHNLVSFTCEGHDYLLSLYDRQEESEAYRKAKELSTKYILSVCGLVQLLSDYDLVRKK